LSSDLEICTSFKIDLPKHISKYGDLCEFEPWKTAFIRRSGRRGLVLAGSDGRIFIITFDDVWTPNVPIEAEGHLTNDIGALSTRDELIIAGSAEGEVGGWNLSGKKLFHINTVGYVQSISIRENKSIIGQNKFIIAANEGISYYGISQSPPFAPKRTRYEKKDEKKGLDWATYDIEGRKVQWRVKVNRQMTPLNTYRPVLPRHTSQHKIYLLSLRDSSNEIVIHDLEESKEIKRHQMSEDFFQDIQFMWCTYNQLFLITYGNAIYMMNFTKDLKDFQLDCSFKIAECFGLDMSSQR
jgi:hypothetical protein